MSSICDIITVYPQLELGKDASSLLSEEDLKKSYETMYNAEESKQGEFLWHLLSCLGRQDANEIAEKIYVDLIKCEREFSYNELIFFCNYTVYKKYRNIKYDSEGKVKPGYENMVYPMLYFFDDCKSSVLGVFEAIGKGDYSLKIKYDNFIKYLLSKETVNKYVIYEAIHVINHEMVHYNQTYDAHVGLLTPSFFNYISCVLAQEKYSTKDFNEYRVNYAYKTLETEAEISSTSDTVEYIEKHFDKPHFYLRILRNKNRKEQKEYLTAFQYLPNGELLLRDEYDVKAVILGVREKSSLVNEYPQLQYFFKSDGTLKEESDLLKGFSEADDTAKLVYLEIFNYLYGLGDYRDVTTELPDELKSVKYDVIKELLVKECEVYKDLEQLEDRKLLSFPGDVLLKKRTFLEWRRDRIKNYVTFFQVYKVGMNTENDDIRIKEIEECIGLTDSILSLNQILIENSDNCVYKEPDNKSFIEDIVSSSASVENKQVESDGLSEMFNNDDKGKITSLLEPKNRHIN